MGDIRVASNICQTLCQREKKNAQPYLFQHCAVLNKFKRTKMLSLPSRRSLRYGVVKRTEKCRMHDLERTRFRILDNGR